MPKKATKRKPQLVSKIVRLPTDWVDRVDQARGGQSFSDFVRELIIERIGRAGLSDMPAWGQGRPRGD